MLDDRTSKQYKYWSFFHSGSRSAPQQSIMTKCVPPEHLGKVRKSFSMYYFMIPFLPFQIFSIFGAISTLLGMAMSYLNTMVPFLARKNSLNSLNSQIFKRSSSPVIWYCKILSWSSNITESLSPQLYNLTLESFLGASYCLAAGFDAINMVHIAFVSSSMPSSIIMAFALIPVTIWLAII